MHGTTTSAAEVTHVSLELLIQDQQIIPVNVGDHDAGY